MNEKKAQNNLQMNNQLPQIPEVYTNAVMTNMTPYEFEITLGLGSNNYEGIHPVINVRMSPQFAKEFAQLLQDNVKIFEEKFGEIKIFKPVVN
ncbi:MAG TPA: DUF3467 domain-containing protein [Spirochaetota bacterium]|nr:DUF3467 domain-containing protein [Spirochaetota bacterium]HPS85441.1 DUF3467 domain-containing protein [Spirochaetota bacterium]